MICSACHGRRLVFVQGTLLPCQECGGQGELNCCEGMQAQPEAAEDNHDLAGDSPPVPPPQASSIQPE